MTFFILLREHKNILVVAEVFSLGGGGSFGSIFSELLFKLRREKGLKSPYVCSGSRDILICGKGV